MNVVVEQSRRKTNMVLTDTGKSAHDMSNTKPNVYALLNLAALFICTFPESTFDIFF